MRSAPRRIPAGHQDVTNSSKEERGTTALDQQEHDVLLQPRPTGFQSSNNHDGRRPRSRLRRLDGSQTRSESFHAQDDSSRVSPASASPGPSPAQTKKDSRDHPVRWRDLPNKTQLFILTMARLSEPLAQTSLSAYLFYQLRSFDPSLPDATISLQAGILQASFTAAQFLTAMLWGRVSDAEWGGRKTVLLFGLAGTTISCVGFGFSRSFSQAVLWRAMGGALNGNVGVMRTMISEIIREKRFQSRAFLLLPMCFNIGVIVGPVLGGVLSDPVANYPTMFGPNSFFGGRDGVWWMTHWPYALPNLVSACFLALAVVSVSFGLQETLPSIRDRPDMGIQIATLIRTWIRRLRGKHLEHEYSALPATDLESSSTPPQAQSFPLQSMTSEITDRRITSSGLQSRPRLRKLTFRHVLTTNVLITLLAHLLLAVHVGTFNNLWFIFLSTPRFDPNHPYPAHHTEQRLPFWFTGGLGLPPKLVGIAMACMGTIGITLQLTLYPFVNAKFGLIRSYRASLLAFPLAYTLAPFLAVVPGSVAPPAPASGLLFWGALATVLFVQVMGRTFALPGAIILVNNSSPHPSVLGTVHGLAQSVSSAARTVGPLVGGWAYGFGLQKGVVGGVWWALAVCALFGVGIGCIVREGSGREIWLEGEEAEEEMEKRNARPTTT